MDAPGIDLRVHSRALRGLGRLNRVSGVTGSMYRRLRRMTRQQNMPLRILDIASGGGDVPIGWLVRARNDGLDWSVTALDISEQAAEIQQRAAAAAGVQLESRVTNVLVDPLPSGFNMVTCSLFLHHLDPSQVVTLIGAMAAAADRLLVCDLERSRLNLTLVQLGARIFSRSPIVHHDADASVRGAFTRGELSVMAAEALGRPVEVAALFPSRMVFEA